MVSHLDYKTSAFSPNTKMVHDWIMEDQKTHTYWLKQAKQHRSTARYSDAVKGGAKTIDQVAAQTLAKELHEELLRQIPRSNGEVHRKLLERTLTQDVNCFQIAEMLLVE